jgi:hypothetical protein
MKIERTGEMVAFLDIGIGSPFFAHKRLWVRTDFDAAAELRHTRDRFGSTRNFLIDGTVEPKYGSGEKCELVEAVRLVE